MVVMEAQGPAAQADVVNVTAAGYAEKVPSQLV